MLLRTERNGCLREALVVDKVVAVVVVTLVVEV